MIDVRRDDTRCMRDSQRTQLFSTRCESARGQSPEGGIGRPLRRKIDVEHLLWSAAAREATPMLSRALEAPPGNKPLGDEKRPSASPQWAVRENHLPWNVSCAAV